MTLATLWRRCVPRLDHLEDRTLLSVCVVDRLTDVGEGKDFTGDLRYCLTEAQDEDSVQFAVKGTINLTRALPQLTRSISIEGPGADLLTVRRSTGPQFYRVFTVSSSATVIISGLTISNAVRDGGGIFNSGTLTISYTTISGSQTTGSGGGIENLGTATITNTTISNNIADSGGGVANYGPLMTIRDSTISGNEADASSDSGFGGGISNGSGTLVVINSTISGNVARPTAMVGGEGGGIANDGMLTVINSTISHNGARAGGGIGNFGFGTLTVSNSTIRDNVVTGFHESGFGGAIFNGSRGALTVSNSTISGNRTNGWGGGILNWSGTLTINDSTITGNWAESGGMGGGGIVNRSGQTLYMRNTILAGNTASSGPDLGGSLTTSGYNLIGNTEGGDGYDYNTDLLDVDPLLGPLADNGGPTLTHALRKGSPALDSGDNTDAPEFDQRGEGFPRLVNEVIDRGAFEVQVSGAPGAPDWLLAVDLVGALTLRKERPEWFWAAHA